MTIKGQGVPSSIVPPRPKAIQFKNPVLIRPCKERRRVLAAGPRSVEGLRLDVGHFPIAKEKGVRMCTTKDSPRWE